MDSRKTYIQFISAQIREIKDKLANKNKKKLTKIFKENIRYGHVSGDALKEITDVVIDFYTTAGDFYAKKAEYTALETQDIHDNLGQNILNEVQIIKESQEFEVSKYHGKIQQTSASVALVMFYFRAMQRASSFATYLSDKSLETAQAYVAEKASDKLQFALLTKDIEMIKAALVFIKESKRAAQLIKEFERRFNNQSPGTLQKIPVVVKYWHNSHDERVRYTHWRAEIENGWVPIMEPFKVGASELMFPRDASLGAYLSEIIRCRCAAIYDVAYREG